MKRWLAACILMAATVRPADAHSPFPGIGEFYNGMLHPLVVPAYALAIVGLGLLFGQKAPRSSRLGLPAFALGLVVALAIPASLVAPLPMSILLGIVFAAGLVVALSLGLGAVGPGLFGVAGGVLIGLDAGRNAVTDSQTWIALAGLAVSATIAVALVAGFAMWLAGRWQGIGVRVLGSWTAASAFLVIALSLASTPGNG